MSKRRSRRTILISPNFCKPPLRYLLIAAAVLGCMLAGSSAVSAADSGPLRISQVGPDSNPAYDADAPATAYDPALNRYLVVWQGNDNPPEANEIYGRFVGATGVPLGSEFRISDMGPEGNPAFEALKPAVAFDARANEYLVVWYGDDATNDEFEIHGQRLTGAGAEVGPNDFRISQMGPDGSGAFDASRPAVTYNSQADEYLVVWYGDAGGLNEYEIYGQRLTSAGAQVGANDFAISDIGPNGDPNFDAFKPAVTYGRGPNEYLVVWYGQDAVAGEDEIYGQRLSAAGADVGVNDFRISHAGPDGNTSFAAARPAVAYGAKPNEYMVVWDADDNKPGVVDNEFEIYGQRLNAAGAELGAKNFRISHMGGSGSNKYDAVRPSVEYGSAGDEFLVAWYGDDAADEDNDIYGNTLSAAGTAVGLKDFRISHMGPDGDVRFGAQDPALAYGSQPNEYLTVWAGDDSTTPLADDEFEIFGRRTLAGGGGATGPGGSTRAPSLKLTARKKQRIVRQRAAIAFAKSDEAVSLSAKARVTVRTKRRTKTIRLKQVKKALSAGKKTKLRFKLSRKARRTVGRALRRHGRVLVRVTVRVTDADAHTVTKKLKIRARR